MTQALKRNLFLEFSMKHISESEEKNQEPTETPESETVIPEVVPQNEPIFSDTSSENSGSNNAGNSNAGKKGAGGCCGEGLVEYLIYMDYAHWHSGIINYDSCAEKCGLVNCYLGGCLGNPCYVDWVVLHTCPVLCCIPGCH